MKNDQSPKRIEPRKYECSNTPLAELAIFIQSQFDGDARDLWLLSHGRSHLVRLADYYHFCRGLLMAAELIEAQKEVN